MALIKDRQLVDDTFRRLDEGAAVPSEGDVLVRLGHYCAAADQFRNRRGRTGVLVGPENTAAELTPHLDQLALIAVEFPKYTDGRGYSLARRLRRQHDYRGELRAVGDVLRDQLQYMQRCGFDAFELKAGKDAEGALEAFGELTVAYQGSADDPRPLFRRAL